MDSFLTEFLSASMLMGIGIGIDAALVTFMLSAQMKSSRSAFKWVLGVSLTHTVFPMVGYLISWLGLQQYPMLSPLIGLLAFFLIAHFIIGEIQAQQEECGSEDFGALIGLGLLLAVSWDALWSGPAKSAQVISWPESAVWASFIIVGVVVALLTSLSLTLSRYIQNKNQRGLQLNNFYPAQMIQYGVISYFGWLALFRYTFSLDIHSLYILAFSFVVVFVLFPRSKSAPVRV